MLSCYPIKFVIRHLKLYSIAHKDKEVSSYNTNIDTVHESYLSDYKLVIICSNEEEDKSHMISKLQFYRRPFTTLHSVQTFSQYLITHFISWPHNGLKGQRILASVVDPEK